MVARLIRSVLVVVALAAGRNAGAVTSNDDWQSFAIASQDATFDATIDATPEGAAIDGIVGLGGAVSDFYTDLAVIVRFNDRGTIDARNDDTYEADVAVTYTANTAYAFRLTVDIPAHTYSVWVTPAGRSEIALATDYAFRSEQANITSLENWATIAAFGTMEVELAVVPAGTSGYQGLTAADCAAGEYFDLTTETCEVPEEQGCAAVGGAPLAVVLFWIRRRR